MTELADRLREATVVLRSAYAEQLDTAVSEVGELQSLRTPELLSFARAAFPARAVAADFEVVRDQFRRRGVEGEPRTRQLWSTLAGLVMINRFERGPGRRSDAKIAPDSVAASVIAVLADQGLVPVHPDVVTRARRWSMSVAEFLRARSTLDRPADLPAELQARPAGPAQEQTTPEGAGEQAATSTPASPPTSSTDQMAALIGHVANLSKWATKSSNPARVDALEEQLALLWWLESAESRVKGNASVVSVTLRACDELIATTRFFPGPPSSKELLKRRLGPLATKPLTPQTIADRAAREVPSALADVCCLLNGRVSTGADDEMPAIDLASQLYSEMVLVELVKLSLP